MYNICIYIYLLRASNKMFVFFFSIPFICLLFIFLILYVIWDSAPVLSPSGKELNLFSQEDTHFSRHCTLAY